MALFFQLCHFDKQARYKIGAVVEKIIFLERRVPRRLDGKLRIGPAFIEPDRLVDYILIAAFKAVVYAAAAGDEFRKAA